MKFVVFSLFSRLFLSPSHLEFKDLHQQPLLLFQLRSISAEIASADTRVAGALQGFGSRIGLVQVAAADAKIRALLLQSDIPQHIQSLHADDT